MPDPLDRIEATPIGWRYRVLVDKHSTGPVLPGEISMLDVTRQVVWGKPGQWRYSDGADRPNVDWMTEPEPLYALAAVEELRQSSRWETGFRNIVTIVASPRVEFEIPDIVETVRGIVAERDQLRAACDAKDAYIDRLTAAISGGKSAGGPIDEYLKQVSDLRAQVEELTKPPEADWRKLAALAELRARFGLESAGETSKTDPEGVIQSSKSRTPTAAEPTVPKPKNPEVDPNV